jgi:PPM family protein phosphatase
MKVEFFGTSLCGPHRFINQDSFYLLDKLYYDPIKISVTNKKSTSTLDKSLFAVADGMGGQRAGEAASQFVLERMTERLRFESDINLYNYRPLQKLIYELNKELNEHAVKINEPSAGTTLSGVLLGNEKAVCFHVGDSSIYHYYNQKIEKISIDHTFKTGNLMQRNYLTSCVGGGTKEIKIEIIDLGDKIQSGSVILLLTDGVTEIMEDDEFAHILIDSTDPKRFCKICIQEALIRDPKDNVTVVAMKFI